MRRTRLSLRWRLALLYGGLLAVVSAVLLALAVWLVDRAIAATAGFAPGTLVRVRTSTGRTSSSEPRTCRWRCATRPPRRSCAPVA
ncbi:MAG: hypothetical protein WKF47_07685 [Geodermatophilaceae bacterium]